MSEAQSSRAMTIAEARASASGTAMTTTGPNVPIFSNMGQIVEFGKAMAQSGVAIRAHLRGNVGACVAITMQAQRLEMDPFVVANNSYEVNNQLAYEGKLIIAIINTRAPIKGRLKTRFEGEGPKRRCCASATFVGEDEPTEVWSPEFAAILPKNSPLWKTDPDQQLAYYTKRSWARRECPEVLLGVYDREELATIQGGVAAFVADGAPARPTRDQFVQIEATAVDADGEVDGFDPEMFSVGLISAVKGAQTLDDINTLMAESEAEMARLSADDRAALHRQVNGIKSDLMKGATLTEADKPQPDPAPVDVGALYALIDDAAAMGPQAAAQLKVLVTTPRWTQAVDAMRAGGDADELDNLRAYYAEKLSHAGGKK